MNIGEVDKVRTSVHPGFEDHTPVRIFGQRELFMMQRNPPNVVQLPEELDELVIRLVQTNWLIYFPSRIRSADLSTFLETFGQTNCILLATVTRFMLADNIFFSHETT